MRIFAKFSKSLPNPSYLKRAIGLTTIHKSQAGIIIFLTLGVAASNVMEPLILKFIFDSLELNSGWKNIFLGIILFLSLALTRETIVGITNWLTWRTRLTIHYGLLNATVDRLHRLPFDFHRDQGVGAIMTKLEKGIQGFVSAISEITFNVLPALAYLIIAMVVMFQLDWTMTLVVLIFVPMPIILAALASPRQVKRERALMGMWGKIYARFNEVLSGIVTVRSFAMEDYEKSKFLRDVGRANHIVIEGIKYDSTMGALQNFAVTFARIAAIGVGGWLVIQGEISLGTLIAFLGYVGGLFGPVQGLTNIYKTLQTATVSLDHIFSILDTQDYLGDVPNAKALDQVKGKVEFKNIHFRYQSGKKRILNGINLHIQPGENIAIVGPSGSGKSTIMALLQRFYDPQIGQIFIDNQDIKKIKQKSIRNNIGVVLQDALLFNESIRSNIAYGRPGASFAEIESAAASANAHEFISSLEKGYETIAGERGSRLSVGERQRIAIARALLKDPPILILDEATSALDAELEAKVQEALERLMVNRTSFIIAHRLSTIVNADRIIVIKNGIIAEAGNHRELVHNEGYYAYLVNRQTQGLLV
ncbi:MAG: ABC transporter ATP-binding protein [Candidatus Cyclobacteriaceae bacterium M3_2C_046]